MSFGIGHGPARVRELRSFPRLAARSQSDSERLILVAVDGSPSAPVAVRMAAELARSLGARIIILRVLPIETYAMSAYPSGMNDGRRVEIETERLERLLKRTLGEHRDLSEPELVIAFGTSPHRMIAEVAEKRGADVVVMGADGGGRIRRFFFGSIADKTRRVARCPVLTASADSRSRLLGP